MAEPQENETLTDDEIETIRIGTATRPVAATADDGDDSGDTGDDTGDVSDTTDTGDDSGDSTDTGDDSAPGAWSGPGERGAAEDALALTLEPVSAASFLDEYWEQQPLVIPREERGGSRGCSTSPTSKAGLRDGDRMPAFRLVKDGSPLPAATTPTTSPGARGASRRSRLPASGSRRSSPRAPRSCCRRSISGGPPWPFIAEGSRCVWASPYRRTRTSRRRQRGVRGPSRHA